MQLVIHIPHCPLGHGRSLIILTYVTGLDPFKRHSDIAVVLKIFHAKGTLLAYTLLRRNNFCVRSLRWLRPTTRNFALGILTCWYLKMLKFALPPTRILKFALPPARNPNPSQWNICCVGSQTQISHVGHVHYYFFSVASICVGYRVSVEYGLNTLP